MCGIAGRFSPEGSLNPEDRLEIQAMTDHLWHRGPDAEGVLDRAPLAVLGHRRLAIIDVKHGHQPMSTADGEIWITYNGEVYNFRRVRSELEGKGHRFTTNSDTEVILEAYRAWGEACVERLEGMFAFAILDLPRRSLLLARDHLGKKPLYFRWRRGRLDFASELSALSLASDWQDDLDPLAWSFYLRLGYIPSPWTIYRGIEKLRPGRVLRRRREWFAEEEILDAGCRFRASFHRRHPADGRRGAPASRRPAPGERGPAGRISLRRDRFGPGGEPHGPHASATE